MTTAAVRAVSTVGLVGCGRMGRAIAGHLLSQGVDVVAADTDPSALDQVVTAGARPYQDAESLAGAADLVLVVVVDDDQVNEAVAGGSGLLAGIRPGSVIAVCASVRPDTCRALASAASRRDVHLIDVALVRGERGAEEGRLALMCGGAEEVVEACRPTLSRFATDVIHLGEVGSGQVAKTANNILLWACLRADVEALRLGRALGVEPARLRAALVKGSGANLPLEEWGKHRLRWPHKDLDVARKLAREAGVDVPLVDSLPPLFEALSVEDLRDLH
jgi:3-hydroxyisobutyrate dehydrogenase-like beta-hydroxyacid dehydrogenase